MKRLLFLLLLACVSFLGCDENVDIGLVAEQILSEQVSAVQTTLPEDVLAAMQREADKMDEYREYVLGPPPDLRYNRQAVIDNFIEQRDLWRAAGIADLDFHELQKAYYTKYIDAGGIAIVAPEHVEDVLLIAARDAILVMTSRYSELRENLSSKHRMFYMILVKDYDIDFYDMPEFQLNTFVRDHVPLWWTGSCYGSMGTIGGELRFIDYPSSGYCWASMQRKHHPTRTFIHEFAHALEGQMERLKPGFSQQVEDAYDQMIADIGWEEASKYHAGSAPHEFWATGVEHWFHGEKGQKYVYDNFPMLAEIIAEWFPKVEYVEDSEWIQPDLGDGWVGPTEVTFHSISWVIVEE
ncbi:hypothetical protein F4X90_06020 [Candidatus Poribacteria bacterium]|nr:hypothetical protein [Candidatus Poribacteria bacterium]